MVLGSVVSEILGGWYHPPRCYCTVKKSRWNMYKIFTSDFRLSVLVFKNIATHESVGGWVLYISYHFHCAMIRVTAHLRRASVQFSSRILTSYLLRWTWRRCFAIKLIDSAPHLTYFKTLRAWLKTFCDIVAGAYWLFKCPAWKLREDHI